MKRPQRGRRRRPGGFNSRSSSQWISPITGVICEAKCPVPMTITMLQTFRIQLRNAIPMNSNGSGVIASYISADPSSTTTATFGSGVQFPEWANVAALFNEVKLLQFEAYFQKTEVDETKGDVFNSLGIASIYTGISSTPANYQAVMDNADSQSWPLGSDQSGKSRYHAFRMRQVAWATVTTPNPGSSNGIAAGCPGYIIVYGSGYPISTEMGWLKVVGTYLLRTRV